MTTESIDLKVSVQNLDGVATPLRDLVRGPTLLVFLRHLA